MTAETLSEQMQNPISSLERDAVRIENMISGSRDCSKMILDVQNSYVHVAKLIAATITSQINSNLTAKD